MSYGLRQQDLDEIIVIIRQFAVVESALIFGSRAKGNFKKGSDVDVAIKGTFVTRDDIAALSFALNEDSAMPYFFDIVQYETITEKALVEHIDRVGQVIYSQQMTMR
jgi:predicted nucleotidyltransferase